MEITAFFIYFILAFIALCAGFIDTLAGGGGLITVPAILMTGMNPIAALGTNKLQSAIGELSASLYFIRKSKQSYRGLLFAMIYTIIGATIGTILLQITPITKLEKIIPYLLLFVLIYYIFNLKKKDIDYNLELKIDNKKFFALGNLIGFYNGFFGPGTGSIWTIALIKFFKVNLQKATIYAKPLNLAGNLTALSIFIVGGKVDFIAAITMGIGSYLGGKLGARFIIYKDIKWLKLSFLILMIISTSVTFIKYS